MVDGARARFRVKQLAVVAVLAVAIILAWVATRRGLFSNQAPPPFRAQTPDWSAVAKACDFLITSSKTLQPDPDWHGSRPGETPDLTDPRMPSAIRALPVRSIIVRPPEVWLEMGGGFAHYGIKRGSYPQSMKHVLPLGPGLWFYAESDVDYDEWCKRWSLAASASRPASNGSASATRDVLRPRMPDVMLVSEETFSGHDRIVATGIDDYVARFGDSGWLAGLGDERQLTVSSDAAAATKRVGAAQPVFRYPLRVKDVFCYYYLRQHVAPSGIEWPPDATWQERDALARKIEDEIVKEKPQKQETGRGLN